MMLLGQMKYKKRQGSLLNHKSVILSKSRAGKMKKEAPRGTLGGQRDYCDDRIDT